MLSHKHGEKALAEHHKSNEKVAEASATYEEFSNKQAIKPIYKFDHHVRSGEHIKFEGNSITMG